MKNPQFPKILIFLIVGILILVSVYLYFRISEKIDANKQATAGNWFTNLFTPKTT